MFGKVRDMKIGAKIASGFVVIILLAAVVGAIGWNGVNTIRTHMDNITVMGDVDMVMNEAVIQNLLKSDTAFGLYVSKPTEEHLAALNESLEAIEMGVAEWETLIQDLPALKEVVRTVNKPLAVIKENKDLFVESIAKTHEIDREWGEHLDEIERSVSATMEEVIDPTKMQVEKQENVAEMSKWSNIDMVMNEAVIANVLKLQTISHMYTADPTEEHWAGLVEGLKATKDGLQEWREVLGNEMKMVQVADHIEGELDFFEKLSKQYYAVATKEAQLFMQTEETYKELASVLIDAMEKNIDPAKTAASEAAVAAQNMADTLIVAFTTGALILGIFLSFVLARGIAGPIADIANTVIRVASDRDLTLKVPVAAKDEVGMMANEFNKMLGELDSSFMEVQVVSEKVAANAVDVAGRASSNRDRSETELEQAEKSKKLIEAMSGTAGKVAEASVAQQNAAEKSKETVGELLKSMVSVNDASVRQNEEAATATDRVAAMGLTGAKVAETSGMQGEMVVKVTAAINEISAVVQDMAQAVSRATEHGKASLSSADEGKGAVENTVAGMHAIAESSGQISEIIGVITEIAEQTNLLALNAAIEAARAGAHGKGFAVVADEVGKLAQRSSEAAKEITQLIKDSTNSVNEGTKITEGLQSSLQKIEESGQNNMEAIENISERASVVEGDILQVQSLVDELNTMAEQISTMSGEQGARRKAAEEALESMVEQSAIIGNLVVDANTGAQAIDEEMQGIVERTEEMNKMVTLQGQRSKAAIDIAAQSADGALKTKEGAGIVVAITDDLQKFATNLQEQVGQFKISGTGK